MGIFDRFKKEKKRSFFPEDSSIISSPYIFSAEINATVATCVNKIANTLSILPLNLYFYTKNGKSLAVDNPLFRILEHPAYEETPSLFYGTMIRHLLLNGNAYILVQRENGIIVNLQLIDPRRVIISRESSRKIFDINGKRYTEKDILHIPYPGTGYNGTIGVSPADVHRDIIQQDNILHEYIAKYFGNSVGSRLAIELGSSYPNKPQDMDKVYAALNPIFKKFVLGNSNAGKPMYLPPDSKIANINQPTNAESELRTLLNSYEHQIAMAFNVPYEIIDSSASKYGSLEQKQNDFLSNCIQPLGDHICQSLMKLLDNPRGKVIQYEYKNLLTTNTTDTIDYLAKEIQSGLITQNEARKKLGMQDIGPAGDYFWIPGNLIPATEENVEAILAKSKLALKEAESIDHNPNGDDKS